MQCDEGDVVYLAQSDEEWISWFKGLLKSINSSRTYSFWLDIKSPQRIALNLNYSLKKQNARAISSGVLVLMK